MKIYRLNPESKTMTWTEWLKIGGCGLSAWAEYDIKMNLCPMAKVKKDNLPLGDIARVSVKADREIARYGLERLGIEDWCFIEYQDA